MTYPPLQVKKNIRLLLRGHFFAAIASGFVALTYLTGFLLKLNASNFQIGLLSAIPSLGSLSVVFCFLVFSRIENKKPFMILTNVLYWGFFSILGTIPFFLKNTSLSCQATVVLSLLVAIYFTVSLPLPYWNAWVSEIVPESQRGKYFGKVQMIWSLVAMVTVFFVGKFLDIQNNFFGFFLVFGVGGLIGCLELICYALIPPSPTLLHIEKVHFLKEVLQVFKNPHAIHFFVYVVFAAFTGNLCGSFSYVFMIQTLQIPYTQIALFGILYAITYNLFLPIWGYIVDKIGNKPVLLVCSFPSLAYSLLWIFNAPDNYLLIPLAYLLSGITSAGAAIASSNLLFGMASKSHKTVFFSVHQILSASCAALSPLVGSIIVEQLSPLQFDLFGFPIIHYQILFGISGISTLLPIFLLTRIQEVEGQTSFYLLKKLKVYNPVKLALNVLLYHQDLSQEKRVTATMALGETKSPLVASELINSLDDPNYFVRREAALALGRIKDAEAVPHLIQKLSDEFANIQYEAAWALGSIKNPRSLNPLFTALKSSDKRLRGYAAMALGEIGEAKAIDPLMEMLEQSDDVFETTSAANALSVLGYKKAMWKTLEKLVASQQAVVRRQLSVSLGDLLMQRGSFYKLLLKEEKVYGDHVILLIERIKKIIQKKWKAKFGEEEFVRIENHLDQVLTLYLERKYYESLKTLVITSEIVFGKEAHMYNFTIEIGRKFLSEILTQNEKVGHTVYWEECLLSLFEFTCMVHSTEIKKVLVLHAPCEYPLSKV